MTPCTSIRPVPSRSASAASASSAAASCPRRSSPRSSELEAEFRGRVGVDEFRAEYAELLASYAGRPTPVTECHRLSERLGVRVLLKREDLTHTGSHKINNVLGQALLTRRMGKQRVIAETGAGQHGVATATAAALFGLDCIVFMGAVDVERQALNVWRMKLLGAEVVPVDVGERDAEGRGQRGDARLGRDASRARTTASVRSMGPHPFPWMVREFQRVVGDEAREQCRAILGGDDPDVVVACVGGGSNAIGHVRRLRRHRRAARRRRSRRPRARVGPSRRGGEPRRARASCTACARCSCRTRTARSSRRTRSAPGLDYPGVGPEHAMLAAHGPGRVPRPPPTTRRSPASSSSSATEGIVPALEPAHAIGWLAREAGRAVPTGSTVLVTLSGRGDKDAAQVAETLTGERR